MLCWPEVRRILRISRDQRVDVVADAALAELAEAGEVAADLGRVDVGVLGELLRGDRLAAHLARLGQHLQVAREARGDAEREALAFDREAAPAPRAPRSPRPCPHSIEPGPQAGFVQDQLGDDRAVDLDHGDSLEVAPQQQLVALDVDLAAARSGSPPRAGRRSPRSPPRRGGSQAASRRRRRSCGGFAAGEGVVAEVVGVRQRPGRSGRRSRSSRRCRCRARAGPASGARRAPRRAPPPPRAAGRWRRRRRRAPRPPTRPSSAPASASRSAGRRPPPGRRRRGRRGARRPPPRPSSRQR